MSGRPLPDNDRCPQMRAMSTDLSRAWAAADAANARLARVEAERDAAHGSFGLAVHLLGCAALKRAGGADEDCATLAKELLDFCLSPQGRAMDLVARLPSAERITAAVRADRDA